MKVFIASSSRDDVSIKYKEMTARVATFIARGDNKLVFGGSESGMMGKSYMTFKYEGKKVKAVTELSYADNLKYLEVDASDVKRTTFERTMELFESADIILFLPGGIGTLAELFSILEEVRTKKIDKLIILFNYDNYYLGLLSALRKMHEERFISSDDLKLLTIINEEETLENYFKKLGKKEL